MGAGEAFICAGVESMTRVPMMGFNPMPNPALARGYPQAYVAMGETAENLARSSGSRAREQEEFAARSHKGGRGPGRRPPRRRDRASAHGDATVSGTAASGRTPPLERLAGLKPAFDRRAR